MQEEIEQKTITLMINGSKLTGRTLASGFSKVLRFTHNAAKNNRQAIRHNREAAKQEVRQAREKQRSAIPRGKQSVKELIAQNQGVETAEITDKDEAKKFDRIAKKYGVDYAIRKGKNEKGETRYILFFKARDSKAIDQMMDSYTIQWHTQGEKKDHSFRRVLQELIDNMPGKSRARDKERTL